MNTSILIEPSKISERIEDVIGEEYTKWGSQNIILISSPTGSGKTHFILNKLLEYAFQQGRSILYLVNRKILKEQIDDKLSTEVQAKWGSLHPFYNRKYFIEVWTYQSIEQQIKQGNNAWLQNQLSRFSFIIFDECHYFLEDSLFNPATTLSFQFLNSQFRLCTRIFMSATLDKILPFIHQGLNKDCFENRSKNNIRVLADDILWCLRVYKSSPNYGYIQLHSIESVDDIPGIVNATESKSKWLIFIDSISKGKKLKKALSKLPSVKDNVVFIHAKYKQDVDAYESVLELQWKESISKRIVISTAVMDNGISLHDRELQNIVIFADTEEEFIQMLGRKRKDGSTVNLYICKRDCTHFENRLRDVDRILRIYDKYMDSIERVHLTASNSSNLNPIAQQQVMEDMLNNDSVRDALKHFCYLYQGTIYASGFSIVRLYHLREYYDSMIESLKNDENAFLIAQARWLHFSDKEIEEFIQNANMDQKSSDIQQISNIICNYIDRPLTTEVNKEMTKLIRPFIKRLLSNENGFAKEEITSLTTASKGDRAFVSEKFNKFVWKFPDDLPYEMEKRGKQFYIKRLDPA